MKKFLAITSVVACFIASTAFAKTEGSSVGLQVFRADVAYRSSYDNTKYDDTVRAGVSVNYKYSHALPHNFYLAPGVSYDHFGSSTNTTSSVHSFDKVTLDDRMAIRADIGYDVNDASAIYGVVGHSAIAYKAYNYDSTTSSQKRNTHAYAPFYGAGLKTMLSKDFDLTIEYTHQHANLRALAAPEKIKTSIETMGVGLAYRF